MTSGLTFGAPVCFSGGHATLIDSFDIPDANNLEPNFEIYSGGIHIGPISFGQTVMRLGDAEGGPKPGFSSGNPPGAFAGVDIFWSGSSKVIYPDEEKCCEDCE